MERVEVWREKKDLIELVAFECLLNGFKRMVDAAHVLLLKGQVLNTYYGYFGHFLDV